MVISPKNNGKRPKRRGGFGSKQEKEFSLIELIIVTIKAYIGMSYIIISFFNKNDDHYKKGVSLLWKFDQFLYDLFFGVAKPRSKRRKIKKKSRKNNKKGFGSKKKIESCKAEKKTQEFNNDK